MTKQKLPPMKVVIPPQGKRKYSIIMEACFPENPDPKEQEELFKTLDKIIISETMKDMNKNDRYYKEYDKILNKLSNIENENK